MARREICWASPEQALMIGVRPASVSGSGDSSPTSAFVSALATKVPILNVKSSRFRKFGLGYTYHSRDQLRLPAGW